MAEDCQDLFAHINSFGWDNKKRDWVLRERGIDFEELPALFDGSTIVQRSDRQGEVRYMVFGFLDDLEIVVVCTLRNDICWIITARRGSRDERKRYHDRLPRRSTSEGQN
jgi:uncharacterized DUF497 family protein